MSGPLIVMAPHPDDELLGAGGLMARAVARGETVAVIFVTDGSGSDLAIQPHVLRQRRREEACAGLVMMLEKLPLVLFLYHGDGNFEAWCVDITTNSALGRFLSKLPGSSLLVTDPADAHPDHKAAFGLASRIVSAGLVDRLDVMPISQRVDGVFDPQNYEAHPVASFATRKADALRCHTSQIESESGFVLTAPVRAAFCDTEYIRPVHNRNAFTASAEAVPAAHFENLFEHSSDPWHYETTAYEADRFRRTIDALGGKRYSQALELGCANGALTSRLLPQCDAIIATDVSVAALKAARARFSTTSNIDFRQGNLPEDLPEGRFDLIVVSDMLYYLGLRGITRLMAQLPSRAAPGCRIVISNYLGATDCVLTGEMAAEIAIAHLPGWTRIDADRTDRLRIDVLERQ